MNSWRRHMRNTKLFWFKIDFILAIIFLLFLSVFSVRFSYANCIPGAYEYFEFQVVEDHAQACPNSGLLCTYGVKENKHVSARCVSGNHQTTSSMCRIRESVVETAFWWNWPDPFGDTTRGPCFPVIGSAPCGSPYEVTTWYQWVDPLGTEDACDISDCFFCEEGFEEIPFCGLDNSPCPRP